jgi:uncharacterized membrane protein YkvI
MNFDVGKLKSLITIMWLIVLGVVIFFGSGAIADAFKLSEFWSKLFVAIVFPVLFVPITNHFVRENFEKKGRKP